MELLLFLISSSKLHFILKGWIWFIRHVILIIQKSVIKIICLAKHIMCVCLCEAIIDSKTNYVGTIDTGISIRYEFGGKLSCLE